MRKIYIPINIPNNPTLLNLSDQSCENVSFLDVEVIVGTINSGRNDCRIVTTVLLIIHFVHHVDHTFGHSVSKVRSMGRTFVNL